MKCSLGTSNFLEEISSLSHSIVFLCFFALIAKKGFLISPCYSLELCMQMGTGSAGVAGSGEERPPCASSGTVAERSWWSSHEEIPHVQGAASGGWAVQEWWVAERKYPTSKVSGPEDILHVQGKEQEQRLRFAGAAVKRYPTSKVWENQEGQ